MRRCSCLRVVEVPCVVRVCRRAPRGSESISAKEARRREEEKGRRRRYGGRRPLRDYQHPGPPRSHGGAAREAPGQPEPRGALRGRGAAFRTVSFGYIFTYLLLYLELWGIEYKAAYLGRYFASALALWARARQVTVYITDDFVFWFDSRRPSEYDIREIGVGVSIVCLFTPARSWNVSFYVIM